MDKQVMRLFEDFGAAERARAELLADGIAQDRVQLTAYNDEAGPTASNFTVGNDPDVVGGEAYQRTFAPRGPEGHYIMIVSAADEGQAGRAAAIMDRYGATSGDPAAQPPGRSHEAHHRR
jgi:hypothetical protein